MTEIRLYVAGWHDEKRDPNYPPSAIDKFPAISADGHDRIFGYNGDTIGYEAGIEIEPEGYFIPLENFAICSKCQKRILQYAASSTLGGMMSCDCSEWRSEISPFSGSAYTSLRWKRDHIYTTEEIVQRKLQSFDEVQRLVAKKLLAGEKDS